MTCKIPKPNTNPFMEMVGASKGRLAGVGPVRQNNIKKLRIKINYKED
jgi:hypothetical protein